MLDDLFIIWFILVIYLFIVTNEELQQRNCTNESNKISKKKKKVLKT